MVLDLIACNGAKRTYYVLNGTSISPYSFHTSGVSGNAKAFQVKTESNAITLTTQTTIQSGLYRTLIPNPSIDLNDSRNLCFVMSCERFEAVALSVNILPKGSTLPDSNLKRVININNNGETSTFKVNLENLLADEYSIYDITLEAYCPYEYGDTNQPYIKLYQMYAE